MGGDLIVTANVSTLAGLIAAAAGMPMCKHGSPATPTVDVWQFRFHRPDARPGDPPDKEVLERCVETECFGYIEALDTRYKHIHSQTHDVAQLPHMNDIIGPITSPVDPQLLTRRVVGLNQLVPPRMVAEAYRILDQRGTTDLRHGLFVRGFADKNHLQGIDELSLCAGRTQVAELHDDEIREFTLTASDFGLSPISVESISPPKPMSKGEFSLRILRHQIDGAPLRMILANASLLFVLPNRRPTTVAATKWRKRFSQAAPSPTKSNASDRSFLHSISWVGTFTYPIPIFHDRIELHPFYEPH